jgi:predicted phage tail protein
VEAAHHGGPATGEVADHDTKVIVNRVNARAAAVPLSGRRESYAERLDGPARPRIRWAWIAGCVVLGLAAIAAGWAIVLDANRTGYVAGVLANVGTTLLLVGIVVLLERRIVDTAVRAVRNANDRRAAPLATTSTRRSATSRSGSARAGGADRWTPRAKGAG